jgi:chromosome segregation ATPase
MAISDSLCIDHPGAHDSHLNFVNSKEATQTVNGPEISSAKTIAAMLDREFKLSVDVSEFDRKDVESQENISNNSSTANTVSKHKFSSPKVDKVWIPLSQSTPMGVDTQPKDILKAKSKLSNLVDRTLENSSNEDIAEEQEEDQEEDFEDKAPNFDDTPSKVKTTNRRNECPISQTQMKELKELRKLKELIQSLPNGELLCKEFERKSDYVEKFSIEIKETLQKSEELNKSLQKENDILREDVKTITSEMHGLSSQIEELMKELRTAEDENQDLNSQIKTSSLKMDELSRNLNGKDDLTSKLRADIVRLSSDLEEKSNNHITFETEIRELKRTLHTTKGDPEDLISPEKFPSLANKYRQLELSEVDLLSQVQAQNIIKNILINLNIPYSQIKQRITDMSQILKNQHVLYDFANQIHNLLYEEQFNLIPLKGDKSCLKDCTSQMFQNVELLYKVLKG